jgi:hypothetical protein
MNADTKLLIKKINKFKLVIRKKYLKTDFILGLSLVSCFENYMTQEMKRNIKIP